MNDMLTSLFSRLSSEAYGPYEIFVELVLIGLCVNWCAGVLHGTRGTRPLRGVLIILVVATLIVRAFGWVRLDLLYNYMLTALAFIGLIVFQPELRRAVIRVGDVRFRKRGGPGSQLVAALVKSAGFLSRNRYGAVIAIQRHVDLTGWAENGTLINAEVSANLLNTIFFPNSPLHDLGVIIRGNRVVAANCQFPSAESDEIDAALGSRHLAAVGMSYETDALVLVISEETGVVSLADNGKLTRYLSLDDLSDELTNRLSGLPVSPRDAKRKTRRMRSVIWGFVRRLLVVVPLTLVIWYLADQATLVDARVRVELLVRHEDPRLEVDPKSVGFTTTFSGPVRAINDLRGEAAQGPLELTWDLSSDNYPPGNYSLGVGELRDVLAGLNDKSVRGLNVVGIAPRELRYNFAVDERITRRVAVELDDPTGSVEVIRIEPPEADVILRRSDLPPSGETFGGTVRVRPGEQLRNLAPDMVHRFQQVPLEDRIYVPYRAEPVPTLATRPRYVDLEVRLVGHRRTVENVVVRLFVSPEVLERYEVQRSDLNEWRIRVDAVANSASVAESLGAHSFDAFAPVTSDVLPPAGQALQPQLRTIDVIILAKDEGVSVTGKRTVRVDLIPRPGANP